MTDSRVQVTQNPNYEATYQFISLTDGKYR